MTVIKGKDPLTEAALLMGMAAAFGAETHDAHAARIVPLQARVEPRKHYPHQGKREMQRRMRQMARQARNKP